jgi:predicted secreted protein
LKISHARPAALLLIAGSAFFGAVAMAAPSRPGPCSSSALANATPACGINSPAHITGTIVSAEQRDHYALSAVKGSKVHLTISDLESFGCFASMYTTCGHLRAALVSTSGRQVATTAATAEYPGVEPEAHLSRTLTKTGTYYVVVTGTLGTVTPPPPLRAGTTSVPYGLKVTASPNVVSPSAMVTVPARGGFLRRSVRLEPGGRLVIALDDNDPGTGYSWSYVSKPSRAVLARSSDHTAQAPSGVTGGPATRTITYRAVAAGTTRLKLVYLPPRGNGTRPAASLVVTATVR